MPCRPAGAAQLAGSCPLSWLRLRSSDSRVGLIQLAGSVPVNRLPRRLMWVLASCRRPPGSGPDGRQTWGVGEKGRQVRAGHQTKEQQQAAL